MAHTITKAPGTPSRASHPLYEQLNQVYKVRGQLGLCWCLHSPSGENISQAVRSILGG